MKIIRNDRPEPLTAQRAPMSGAARITPIAIRFAVLIVAALIVLGLVLSR